MRQSRILVLLLGLLLIAPLSAQDTGTDPSAENVGADESANASETGDQSAQPDAEDDDAPAYADDLNDFIPSSEIPPDEQVTFPVDI